MPAAAPAAASLAPIVSENPPRFLFPSLEPWTEEMGRERGTEGMSAPAPTRSFSRVAVLCLF